MAERSRRGLLVGGVAVVVLAGGGVAYAMSGDSGPQYRLATVTRTTVEQTVDESGTVATVSQSSAAFPVSGEVATVPVQLGQTVTAGQTLATLDTTSLQQSLQSANSTAATARQTLANDEAEQSSSGTATDTAYERPLTAAPSSGPGSGGSGSGGSGSGGSASGGGATRALQTAVTTAQHDLDQAIAQVDSDVAAAVKACQTGAAGSMTIAVTADASGDVKGDVGSGQAVTVTLENPDGSPVTGSTPAGPQTGVTGSYTFSGLTAGQAYQVVITPPDTITTASACTAAVAQTSQDQAKVDSAEQALKKAIAALDAALAKTGSGGTGSGGTGSGRGTGGGTGTGSGSSGSTGSSTGHSGTGTAGRTGGTGTSGRSGASGTGSGSATGGTGSGSGGAAGGSRTGTSTVITAEQLAADQKAIDAADAEIAVAQQALDSATLTAPIGGTVAAVELSTGMSVSAGSTSQTITILGSGQREVSTTVGINDIDNVKKGTAATVTVDGVSTPVQGTVSYVGTLNTSGTSGSSSTYPVTVLLDPTSLPVLDGAGASVALHVGSATNALTVPTSAVHLLGTRATVSVYSGGKVTTTLVTLGVRGSDRTQVLSGLKVGQQVVLADISSPVPSSSTTTTGRFGGTGGLGGLTRLGGGGGGGALTRLGGG